MAWAQVWERAWERSLLGRRRVRGDRLDGERRRARGGEKALGQGVAVAGATARLDLRDRDRTRRAGPGPHSRDGDRADDRDRYKPPEQAENSHGPGSLTPGGRLTCAGGG